MTDNNNPITPPLELVEQWSPSIAIDQVTIKNWQVLAAKAAQWGYTQRGAINEAELQKARDEELEAVIAWMMKMGFWGGVGEAIPALRAARRPRPKSLAEQKQAIHDEIHQLLAQISASNAGALAVAEPIRRALERLRELEGNQ